MKWKKIRKKQDISVEQKTEMSWWKERYNEGKWETRKKMRKKGNNNEEEKKIKLNWKAKACGKKQENRKSEKEKTRKR